ncbi:aromatic ring-hydroxylating dioxygenase subunit alpha [Undibacterium sp. TS12]|uniref:aromatic ring-hydroxylating oxygenase subunit alpha n=1 Tax=Undibacterium sp. TS12 TaxID=2908202 RepID=UPI001F4D3501|nr:aromatic ring-hydroxylating dioxygenase subunit alpha [Undibacterium sp. TS12]MCH8619720.1 aromatic ring-hydroxylating dioxygenase subunit alpha [Undibacterium sp. TS12]
MSKYWNPQVRKHWLVVARSECVSHKPLAVTIMDKPMVLVRLPGQQILALEDRCPHRQAPLSQGRMTSEGLQCPYHGWTFGEQGRCTSVPGLPADQCLPAVAARYYAVQELDGLVWVRLAASGDLAPPALIADLPAGSRKFMWQAKWQADIVNAMENFLDPLHTHLVHPGLVRRDNRRSRMQASLTKTAEGFTVDYQGQPEQSGLLYRLFESPRLSERVYFAQPGTAQIEYRYQNGSIVRITLHFTPEGASTTHVFATLHVENRWAPAWLLRATVWPFLKRVAQQDARMLALQEQNLQKFPGSHPVSTSLDLVRPYLEQVWREDKTDVELPLIKTIALDL